LNPSTEKAMKTVSLRIPDDLNEKELLMEIASMLLGNGIMSSGQAAEMAGITKREFLQQVGRYGVSVFNESAEELQRRVEVRESDSSPGTPWRDSLRSIREGLLPLSVSELNTRTDNSMADSAAGRLTSSTELKAEMKRW
jgi:predicted HTH domain antitoxin